MDPSGTGPFLLFQRDDCQLCDEALAVLAQARAPAFESVFIDDDATLEARYGQRIPVFRDEPADRELAWPFTARDVIDFLQGRSAPGC